MVDTIAYLDHNAGTPVRPGVVAAVAEALAQTGNPSSVHRYGRLARRLIEDSRERVAALVDAPAHGVIFTGSGTEADNLALRGAGRPCFATAIEHDAVLQAVPDIVPLAVDGDGVVDLDDLRTKLNALGRPALVSVMFANNETGVIQPVADVVRVAHEHGAWVHCDAIQAAGKVPVSMRRLGVDMLSLSAHKLGGPPGIGALVVVDGVALSPIIQGGGQERGRRAGTENLPAIAGFGAAAEIAQAALGDAEGLAALRDELEAELRRVCPEIAIFGSLAPRLPNTTCIAMPGVSSETQLMAFDLAGLAVSAGAACSSGKVRASHVLRAMGVPAEIATTAIRVSLGWTNRVADVRHFVAAWTALYRKLGRAVVSAPATNHIVVRRKG